MSDDYQIYEGKTFAELTKDIYQNSKLKKTQLDLLIQEAHGYINTVEDLVVVMPVIKELMEVAVKNDEHLVKLAGVVQRIMTRSTGVSDEGSLLSESEKEELLNSLQDVANDLQSTQDTATKAQKKINHIKDIPST
mgnify:FL=1